MSKGGVAVLIVAALVFAALGFVFGQVVQAANNNPGALVTETYVQKYVGEIIAEMQSKIDELEMRILDLSSGSPVTPAMPEQTSDNTTDNPPVIDTPSVSPTSVKIKSDSVNVRSDASASASKVDAVAANTVLIYLGQKNDNVGQAWYNVRLANGIEGWVAGWLCYEPE